MTSIGAVIVNYNAGSHLLACVESVRSEGIDHVVCVDNGSNDGSPEQLIEQWPETTLIRLPNPGFSAANNRGVAELDDDIIFCLNPDTVVHEGATVRLRDTLLADPTIAVVGPRLLNPDGTRYPSARSFPVMSNAIGHAIAGMVWKNNPWTRRYRRLDADPNRRAEVDWVSGSAMFVRRSAFDSVGGFDPRYFMYMEDVDLCWRLRRDGWKIVYEPDAHVTHIGGVSTGPSGYKMLRAHHLSAIRYNARTARGVNRVLLPFVALGLLARLPVAWLQLYLRKRQNEAADA